jgi:hypothetical protein
MSRSGQTGHRLVGKTPGIQQSYRVLRQLGRRPAFRDVQPGKEVASHDQRGSSEPAKDGVGITSPEPPDKKNRHRNPRPILNSIDFMTPGCYF